MIKYTLDELIKFCDEEIKYCEKLNVLFEVKSGDQEDLYILKMKQITEELFRLKDLCD